MRPDKIYIFLSAIIVFSAVVWISSCTHDANISNLPEICFERDVLPIYANNCAISGCHAGGVSGNGHEHFALDTYAEIRNTVTPYKPDQSRSYSAIIATGGEGHMPPRGVLSKEQRTIIRVWIEQGANETTCTK